MPLIDWKLVISHHHLLHAVVQGTVRVLDTKKLDRATRAELLLSVAEEDTSSNLIMLQKLRARLDKCVVGSVWGREESKGGEGESEESC